MEENEKEHQEQNPEEKVQPQKDHVLPVDQAEKEVEGWLAFKKVSEKRRKNFAVHIRNLIEGICLGKLIIDQETKVITQKLDFGIGKGEAIKELKFQPRLKLAKINQSLKGLDQNDPDVRVVAHIAALTGQVNAVINELDSEDAVWAEAIAVFFL